MKPYSYNFLAAVAVTALGLTLAGCQQAPPTAAAAPAAAPAPAQAPAPSTTTESSSSTRSVEVKSDPSNPDAPVDKTVIKESTSEKKQQ